MATVAPICARTAVYLSCRVVIAQALAAMAVARVLCNVSKREYKVSQFHCVMYYFFPPNGTNLL
jgi:hypothetical protein